MLNPYQPYSSMRGQPSLPTLIIVCLCVVACTPSLFGRTIINDTLVCDDVKTVYRVPVNRTNTGSMFAITMQLLNTGTLPAAMAVFTDPSDMSNFNRYDIHSNTHTDIDSIEQGKNKQTLYYQSLPTQTQFYVAVYRLSYQQIQYSTNTDRLIQLYTGSNTYLINTCTIPIKYTIEIIQYNYSLFAENAVVRPPLSASQCKFGLFDSSQRMCACKQNVGMQLCDTYFQYIPNQNQKVTGHISKNSKYYYYYESKQTSGEQIMIIKLKGTISSEYSYKLNQNSPQFQILWNTQPISDKLKAPTIFSQFDPSGIGGLILKSGYRLVVTVYKPQWAHEQAYQIEVTKKSSDFDILVRTLLIAGSVGFVICVLSFSVVYYYKRRFFQRHEEEGISPHPVRFNINNRIFNSYFNIDQNFPTINFQEFNQVLKTLKGWEQNNIQPGSNICSICLDPFQLGQQQNVKITYCCHIFHSGCLLSWMNKQTSCPNCRTQFTKEEMTQIEQAAGTYIMNLQPIDRFIKIWKWVKKIDGTRETVQDPQIECGTCHNLQLVSQNDIK